MKQKSNNLQGLSNREVIIITEKFGAIKTIMFFLVFVNLILAFLILEGPSVVFIWWLGIMIVIFNIDVVYQLAKALKPA